MTKKLFPATVCNWIGGQEMPAADGTVFAKFSPHDGAALCRVARSGEADVEAAVAAARDAKDGWAATTPVRRGEILHALCMAMQDAREEIAAIVAAETGKSPGEAMGETGGAISLGLFYAGEGQRLYGRTTTSGVPGKRAMTIRRPLGIAGAIIAANTPIANVAWKIFPALICGNAVVLKAAEDTPATAWIVGRLARECGVPDGVLNIVQGYGPEAGRPLVRHPEVAVISFTGSSVVGREIAVTCGERMARVSLELGGKNAMVVCDDADMDSAVKWAVLSAFSNAGQRCASGSRMIVFDSVYETFKSRFMEAARALRLGPADGDDLGPVINERQLADMVSAVEAARKGGADVLVGGSRADDPGLADGWYMQPTIIENLAPDAPLSTTEVFGPITCLYRVKDFEEALALANDSPYGLTAAIHTANIHRGMEFVDRVETGVVSVNAGTYGSEPHMPFGGLKLSGNGSREPGTEALDIYSNLKDVYIITDKDML